VARTARYELSITSDDSLLVFAPHPDDETLAAGGLLQRAHEAGARVHICFVTNGENNPWPQRIEERCLRIGDPGRLRLAVRRRRELRAALAELALTRATTSFLGLADRGVMRRVLEDTAATAAMLAFEIRAHRPTLLVAPSADDRHPDHAAVGHLLDFVFSALGDLRAAVSRRLVYRVHGARIRPGEPRVDLALSAVERERKRRAIEAHASQLVVRGRFYRAFARDDEVFATAG